MFWILSKLRLIYTVQKLLKVTKKQTKKKTKKKNKKKKKTEK